jgi:hypothetical protein
MTGDKTRDPRLPHSSEREYPPAVDSLVSSRWSDQHPTESGWYWIKSLALNGIVNVFVRPGHEYLCISNPMNCQHTKRDFLMVAKLGAQWAGPLREPEEAN